MTEAERRAALEAVASEVRACTRCRLHQLRTQAVPGEGHPSTEVVFVGEGPGFNEDRQGRPFVGRAGDLLVKLLATIGWRRDEVFITNVVKCRPPDNRDPEPDEIAACAPYLRRQLEILDPAVVVTLGRHSLGRFMPGTRISQVHGTHRPVDPATGARAAFAYALYHPAAALRSTEVERQSYEDVLGIPPALTAARATRNEPALAAGREETAAGLSTEASSPPVDQALADAGSAAAASTDPSSAAAGLPAAGPFLRTASGLTPVGPGVAVAAGQSLAVRGAETVAEAIAEPPASEGAAGQPTEAPAAPAQHPVEQRVEPMSEPLDQLTAF